ncbi:MAG: hydroxymyristoyl-ACP dehydratase [Tannerella sp.]|jgi:predicted hotdog family 3-hydroxylacyl-ACP dehydratase|nr:hydroxymyristoyl-ACP dehydratase [Tannerella sp.]
MPNINDLIPQREPMIMLDAFFWATDSEACTGLTVADDNLFCGEGFFTEPGLIEHIAQSASAFAGYQAKIAGRPVPIGLIGEVKKFRINFLPCTNSKLCTHLRIISEVFNVTLISAETKVNDSIAAEGLMKIYVKQP